jgi:hypothetical protein
VARRGADSGARAPDGQRSGALGRATGASSFESTDESSDESSDGRAFQPAGPSVEAGFGSSVEAAFGSSVAAGFRSLGSSVGAPFRPTL